MDRSVRYAYRRASNQWFKRTHTCAHACMHGHIYACIHKHTCRRVRAQRGRGRGHPQRCRDTSRQVYQCVHRYVHRHGTGPAEHVEHAVGHHGSTASARRRHARMAGPGVTIKYLDACQVIASSVSAEHTNLAYIHGCRCGCVCGWVAGRLAG